MTEHAAAPAVAAWEALQRVHKEYQRCWSCMLGQHVGGEHEWISEPEDETWLRETNAKLAEFGLPPMPREDMKCACKCVTDLSMAPDAPDEGPPDMDMESITPFPCAICGEAGACGYDQEGRPMIHSLRNEDDGE